jgi:hypothetical protein
MDHYKQLISLTFFFPEKSSVKNMDIRIFGGEGKTLGKVTKSSNTVPKSNSPIPNPNITSAIHKPPNSINRPKPTSTVSRFDDNITKGYKTEQPVNGHVTILPGAVTPSKTGVSKNKPVSQGGVAKFNDKKKIKKIVNIPDFSDSDDDDEFLCSIPISNLSNTSICSTAVDRSKSAQESSQWNNSSISDTSMNCDTSNSITDQLKDNKVFKDKQETETGSDVTNLDDKQFRGTDNEVNDVRAMLRKVWGQKQFGNQTSKMKVKGTFKSVIPNLDTSKASDSSSNKVVTGAHKRLSGDSGFGEKSAKRHKNNNIYTSGSNNSDVDKNSQIEKTSPVKQLTSPIDKFFKKTESGSTTQNDSHQSASVCDKISVIRGDNSGNNNTTTESTSDVSPCPVCNKMVPTTSINDHLDLCLTMQAI